MVIVHLVWLGCFYTEIDRYGLLGVKNRLYPVLTGSALAEQKSENVIVLNAFGSPLKAILTELLLQDVTVFAVFPVYQSFPVTRYAHPWF